MSLPGQFLFHALMRHKRDNTGWYPTEEFYASLEEAQTINPDYHVKWPVEIWEDGTAYVPCEAEVKEMFGEAN